MRVPRIILSVISGGGLALCGVLTQCITKNLDTPYIWGYFGSFAGAVAVIVLQDLWGIGSSKAAFAGALLCGILVFIVVLIWKKYFYNKINSYRTCSFHNIFFHNKNTFLYSAKNAGQVKSAVFWTMGAWGRAKWLLFFLLLFLFCVYFFLYQNLWIF